MNLTYHIDWATKKFRNCSLSDIIKKIMSTVAKENNVIKSLFLTDSFDWKINVALKKLAKLKEILKIIFY